MWTGSYRSRSWPRPPATRSRAFSGPTSTSARSVVACQARSGPTTSTGAAPGAARATCAGGARRARRPASIPMAQAGLEISPDDGARLWWPLQEVHQTQGAYAGEQVRLERGHPFPEVLLIDDPGFLTALHETAPVFGRRFHDPRSRHRRILLTI